MGEIHKSIKYDCMTSIRTLVRRDGKRPGQRERLHGGRGDYLVSLPQLRGLPTAPGTPSVVGRRVVSKREEDRRGHISGGRKTSEVGELLCGRDFMQ